MNDLAKNLILWVIIAIVLMSVFNNFGPRTATPQALPYSQFISEVKSGRVQKVIVDGRNIQGIYSSGEKFNTYSPGDDGLVGDLLKNNVEIDARPPEQQSLLTQIFISWFPMLLLIGVWVFFMRQMQGGAGGRGAMSFGKSRARLLGEDQVKVTFADVAGVEEAKDEVAELVEFLRDPGKFQKLGGKIPRGVLLVGSPGTGKTLLARAIAGEAKVPFFTISGSDFVEMFVGVGASRVRDMFEQAKKHAPCIIFIDEIDAVGRHRGAGLGGGHDEREQTLNQLLVEMDGFEGNEGVIVIAATNRPDVLDPALLPHADPLHKVTIIPRGRALGVTMQLPEGDRHTHSREFLEAQIAILMGGRIAEELFLRQMTSGAGNDIERATDIARRMVCEFGMSAALGPLAYRTPGNPWDTDKGVGISEATAQRVDEEVRELVMRGYETARQIVAKNRSAVRAIAEELLLVESLNAEGIKAVIGQMASAAGDSGHVGSGRAT